MSQEAIWLGRTGRGREDADPAGRSVRQPAEVRKRRATAEIDSRIEHLPPFPTVLTELIGLTNRETSAAQDLRTCIEKDPVLTARVLRLANSAFYSPRVPVTSVQQGVVMLGQMTVKSLAMAAATLKFLGGAIEPYGMVHGGLWMHSYVVADLTREMAVALGWTEEVQDAVYVAGLLHDIGKIVLVDVLMPALREDDRCRRDPGGETVEAWESRVVGLSHSEVGRKIADKWRLAPLTTCCIHHHHADDGRESEFNREIALVSLADAGARRIGAGLQEPDEEADVEGRTLEAVGLSETQFREILDQYAERGTRVIELFSNLGGRA